MLIYDRRGFSVLELMIVVAIIAIAISIAIPNFFHISVISKRTVCINNLKKITAALEQWAIDNSVSTGVSVTPQDEDYIYKNYLRGGKPKCPSGGDYSINTVGANPQVQCTDEGEGHKPR